MNHALPMIESEQKNEYIISVKLLLFLCTMHLKMTHAFSLNPSIENTT